MKTLPKQMLERYLNWAENVDEREIRHQAIQEIRQHIFAQGMIIDELLKKLNQKEL